MLASFNLKQWIDEHRHLLKPPVGNAQVWKDTDFIVMVIGGPNSRKDYHVDPSEEFFYQVEGDIVLKVIENGQPRDIPIREGEVLLLPPMVPHSPRRPANTVGLVIERTRKAEEPEAFEWYCEQCGHRLYREQFVVTDIVGQLPPLFDRYWNGDVKHRTCEKCGTVMERPQPAAGAAR